MTEKNVAAGDRIRSYVERLEKVDAAKKQLNSDRGAILADAKAEGFQPLALNNVVKIRSLKPHDYQEQKALEEMYLHAIGMTPEPPLFRFAGLAGIDTAAQDQVIARMKEFVPAHGAGDIIVNMGGKTFRLVRDKDNTVTATEVVEKPREVEPAKPAKSKPAADVPDVDAEGAFELGREYARDNKPVIDNPFPFGDARRPKFDEGWRKEAGNDGMGPKED